MESPSRIKDSSEDILEDASRNSRETDQLRSQPHEGQQQTRNQSTSNQSAYFGSSPSLQHHQHHQQTSHHAIQSIPEGHSAVSGVHTIAALKDGESPPPQSSVSTVGTTTTPSSTGNSTSSALVGPLEEGLSKNGPVPEFPREGLHSVEQSGFANHVTGAASWTLPLSGDMMNPRYAHTPGSSCVDSSAYDDNRVSFRHNASAIKLLVSNNVAGSIIGRSGQTISDLQAQSSTRIKLSQTGDYYPGSQDRVCLVQGKADNVKTAVRLLLERLYALQEHQHSQQMAWQSNRNEATSKFDFVVRLLVPTSSCGMLIGKSGSNIRLMEEESGVSSVRLSPKEDPNFPSAAFLASTSERVVTLTGPALDSCLNCLFIILDDMAKHPEIGRYSNMSTNYSRAASDPFASGPPLRQVTPIPSRATNDVSPWDPPSAHYSQGPQGGFGKRVSSSPDLHEGAISRPSHSMERDNMQQAGLPNNSREVVTSQLLNAPSNPYAPTHQSQTSPRFPLTQASSAYINRSYMNEPSVQTSVSNSASAPDLLTLQIESLHMNSSTAGIHIPSVSQSQLADYPLFQAQIVQTGPPRAGFSSQVLVPDTLVGSILGRRGITLNEIQANSGTKIRITQRGEYLPGTRSRIVTITGPTAQSVNLAQHLMSQRMILPRTATFQQPALNTTSRHSEIVRHGQQIAMSDGIFPPPESQVMTQHTTGQLASQAQQHQQQSMRSQHRSTNGAVSGNDHTLSTP